MNVLQALRFADVVARDDGDPLQNDTDRCLRVLAAEVRAERDMPTRDEIIKMWELAMRETTSGLDAMEYFTRAILQPNVEGNRRPATTDFQEGDKA